MCAGQHISLYDIVSNWQVECTAALLPYYAGRFPTACADILLRM